MWISGKLLDIEAECPRLSLTFRLDVGEGLGQPKGDCETIVRRTWKAEERDVGLRRLALRLWQGEKSGWSKHFKFQRISYLTHMVYSLIEFCPLNLNVRLQIGHQNSELQNSSNIELWNIGIQTIFLSIIGIFEISSLNCCELFQRIKDNAWSSGDGGVVSVDLKTLQHCCRLPLPYLPLPHQMEKSKSRHSNLLLLRITCYYIRDIARLVDLIIDIIYNSKSASISLHSLNSHRFSQG